MSLPPYADKLFAAGLRSTESSSCQQAWSKWFNRQAEIAEARALLGPRNALVASARKEEGIRQAIGPWPANGVRPKVEHVLSWIGEDPKRFGLTRKPHKDKVSAVIKLMAAEHESGSSVGSGLLVLGSTSR